jgi:uncharacterized membrane protein (UPF0127 family)
MKPGHYQVKLENGSILAEDVVYRQGMLFRMKGLLGRGGLNSGEGILIMPCNSIHMFFMKFPIDAVFLDKEFRVIKIYHSIQPWKMTRGIRNVHAVLEMKAGQCREAKLAEGMKLQFDLKR